MKSLKRYVRLIGHTSDWPGYILDKFLKRSEIQLKINDRIKAIIPRNQIRAIFKEIFMEDFYDFRFLRKVLPKNPVIVDIGANVGYFDLLIFSYFDKPIIYSFEPSPHNYKLIKRHKELNSLENLKIFESAISSKTGTIEFYLDDSKEYSALGSIYKSFSEDNQLRLEIESITLEDLFNKEQIVHLDLLKLDCEGAEYEILYNSLPLLKDKIAALVLETHEGSKENESQKDLLDFLRQLGFKTISKDEMVWAYK